MTDPGAVADKARKRPTLNDVARTLGISRTTVSNAFNRPEVVAKPLLKRILECSAELGYLGPDPMARAMRTRDVHELAVIFHHDLCYALRDSQSVAFLQGVASELDRRDYSLQVVPKMGRGFMLRAAFQATANALIVHAEITEDLLPQLRAIGKPLVLVDTFVKGFPCIRVDDVHGARLAMRYVLSRQPEHVIVACLPINDAERVRIWRAPNQFPSRAVAGRRLCGYLQELVDAGFPLSAVDQFEVHDDAPEEAAGLVLPLLQSLPDNCRVGIVCMSDRIALAILKELQRRQRPTLAALVGFDDVPEAAIAGLSTVRQDSFLKGEQAVRVVLDGLDSVCFPVELVVRST